MNMIALSHLIKPTTALLSCCAHYDYFQVIPNGTAFTSVFERLKDICAVPHAEPNIRPNVQSKFLNGSRGFNL